jgi:hypothetical protein
MGRKIGNFILKFLTLTCFVAVCIAALFYAYGYQYDLRKQDVKKTSIIDLVGKSSEARVSLNGRQVSNFLPYQIKGVEAGTYLLSIARNGFRNWSRNIKVEVDIVTIVNDILLVPQVLDPYMKFIKSFDEKSVLNTSDDLIIAYKKGGSDINMLNMYYDGTFREDDIAIDGYEINGVTGLGNDRFLLHLGGGFTEYYSISGRKPEPFYNPQNAKNIRMDAAGENLFFVLDGDLYMVPYSILEGGRKIDDFSGHKVLSGVENYAFGFGRNLYFICGGGLYGTDFSFGKAVPLSLSLDGFINLSFTKGHDFGALVTRNTSNKRSLYLMDKRGKVLTALSSDLYGKVFFNANDQLIYSEGNGKIFYYDPALKEKVFVKQAKQPFQIAGWFTDEGHFILRQGEFIKLADVFNANEYDLMTDEGINRIFVFNGNLFFLNSDGQLFSLNWKNSI